jgi:predicted dehydrogenase
MHIRALVDSGEEISALCDVLPERCRAAAESYGISPKIYTDYIEMLDSGEVESVHICTPHYLHAPMIVEALKRNIHVLSEKPVAINESQLSDIESALKDTVATLGVCFQNHYNPAIKYAREFLLNREVVSATATVMWQRDKDYYKSGAWRGRWDTEGGGVMINQAIHTLDLMRFLCGMPESVIAHTDNISLKGEIEVEDTAFGRFTLPSGNVFTLFATNAMTYSFPPTITIHADHDTIYIIGDGTVLINDKVISKHHPKRGVGKRVWGQGHGLLIRDFYHCIKKGKRFPLDFYEAEKSVRMILAMYRSKGEEIKI